MNTFCLITLLLLCFISISHQQQQNQLLSEDQLKSSFTNHSAIKIFYNGITKESATTILPYLLNSEIKYQSYSASVHSIIHAEDTSIESKLMMTTNIFDESTHSDVSILFVKPSDLFAEDELLLSLQSGFKAVLKSVSKKTLVVLVASESKTVQQRVVQLLNEAYNMLEDKEQFRESELLQELDVKVLCLNSLVPETMDPATVKTVRNMMTRLTSQSSTDTSIRTLDNILLHPIASTSNSVTLSNSNITVTEGVKIPNLSIDEIKENLAKNSVDISGFDEAYFYVDDAEEWARNKTAESTLRLQKYESAQEFPVFVDNLIQAAINFYNDKIRTATHANGAKLPISAVVKQQGETEIRRRILTLLYPFFRVQSQLARREVAQKFSTLINDDDGSLVNSIYLDKRLTRQVDEYLDEYSRAVRRLVPKSAYNTPSILTLWNGDAEKLGLKEYFDMYASELIAQARLKGVLPRGRKPVAISFHTFLHHPLGRDYRQDIIADDTRSTDKMLFNPNVTLRAISNTLVSAPVARSVLKSTEIRGSRVRSRSEFAREMLMLPLSIKNPEVPFALGRAKKRTGPPKPDTHRAETGPERYVDWDTPELRPAREAVRVAQAEAAAAKSSALSGAKQFMDKVSTRCTSENTFYYSAPCSYPN